MADKVREAARAVITAPTAENLACLDAALREALRAQPSERGFRLQNADAVSDLRYQIRLELETEILACIESGKALVNGRKVVFAEARAEQGQGLFQRGQFTLAGGQESDWKIECDMLTDADWQTLAKLIAERVLFSEVYGVPTGGNKLAKALRQYAVAGAKTLVVDDVFTTGASIQREREKHVDSECWVVFARGPLPPWCRALFTMEQGQGALLVKSQAREIAGLQREDNLASLVNEAYDVIAGYAQRHDQEAEQHEVGAPCPCERCDRAREWAAKLKQAPPAPGPPQHERSVMSNTQVALTEDHRYMKAWNTFCESDEFKNALHWAVATIYGDGHPIDPIHREEHAKGSMWLAFTKGMEIVELKEAAPAVAQEPKHVCSICGGEMHPRENAWPNGRDHTRCQEEAATPREAATGEHRWVVRPNLTKYRHCDRCGVVKRADDKNGPCLGRLPDLRPPEKWSPIEREAGKEE